MLQSLAQLRLTSRLRNKIIFPYIFLTLILAFAGTYVVTRLVTESLDERLTTFLLEGVRVTNDGLAKIESDQLAVLRQIRGTVGMAEAVANRDLAPLRDTLVAYKVNQQLDGLEVVDAQGVELLGFLHGPDPREVEDYRTFTGRDLTSWNLVQRILAGEIDEFGDKFAELIATERGYTLFTGGPVKLGEEIVGAVLVGQHLDNILLDTSRQALAQVTIYDQTGHLVASTISGAGDEGSPFRTLRPDISSRIDPSGGTVAMENVQWLERSYRAIFAPLLIRQRPVGFMAVALPTDFIPQTTTLGRNLMILLFTLASLAVLVIGYLLSERITQPVMKLAQAALRVASGDFDQPVEVKSGDEIGILASAFDSMTRDLKVYTYQLQQLNLRIVQSLAAAMDARDPYTHGHSNRVTQNTLAVAKRMGFHEKELQSLEIACYLHDIGKIGIPDQILKKPSALTEEEWEKVREHPRIGARILEPLGFDQIVIHSVLYHHERYDGRGYPEGLKGEEIPLAARILSVADAFDAMISDRPYRKAMPEEEALVILQENAGIQFDPEVVTRFLQAYHADELVMPQLSEAMGKVARLPTSEIP